MIQKGEKFLKERNVKITRQAHAFKGFPSSYNIEILKLFKPELQIKDAESAIKSKAIDLLTELSGFKIVAALVLVFKKIKQNMTLQIQTQKQK